MAYTTGSTRLRSSSAQLIVCCERAFSRQADGEHLHGKLASRSRNCRLTGGRASISMHRRAAAHYVYTPARSRPAGARLVAPSSEHSDQLCTSNAPGRQRTRYRASIFVSTRSLALAHALFIYSVIAAGDFASTSANFRELIKLSVPPYVTFTLTTS